MRWLWHQTTQLEASDNTQHNTQRDRAREASDYNRAKKLEATRKKKL